jgi:hypothetical protein
MRDATAVRRCRYGASSRTCEHFGRDVLFGIDLAHVAVPARLNSLKQRTRGGARRSVARRMRSTARL